MAEPMAQSSEKLRLAASKGQVGYIRELVKAGAEFTPDKYGRTALHYAANYGQIEAIKLCVHLGCELDTQDVYGCTPLHRAVIDNHQDAIKALLLEGCAVDRQDENGNTALHEAAWTGYDEIVHLLVKQGKANLHAGNKHGNRPLHQSCQNGHSETTRILLRGGSHPSIKNNNGESPLHTAALFGHITCCRILISASSNVNTTNAEGNTPLHVVSGLGKKKISKILIEASTDINIKNNNGDTALEVARKNNHADVVMLLLAAMKLQKSQSSRQHHHHHHHRSKSPHKPLTTHHDRETSKPETAHHRRHDKHTDKVDGGEPSASRVRGRRELRNEETKGEDPEHANKGEVKKHTTKHSAHAKKPVSSMHRTHEPTAQKTQQPTVQKQVTFVKDELRNRLLWEQQLHHQIHRVPDKGRHHKHKHHQKCLYKDDGGQVTQGTMKETCTCSIYIHKLQNQLEASKEKMLSEIDTTRAQFEHKLSTLDKKLTHQGTCLDQLSKERVAAERTECLHRIDRRMLQERALWSEEYERRLSYVRDELRRYFEVRLKTVQEQLSVYYPPNERKPLHGNPSGFDRISEGTEDSSGSDKDPRNRSKSGMSGHSGRLIPRRKQSPSPSRNSTAVSVDRNLIPPNNLRVNGPVNPQVYPGRDYQPQGPAVDNWGRSRAESRNPTPRGRRTGSFTRALHRNASSSPELRAYDSSHKELVSATYIPPIAHPDLPQSSQPREPESKAIAASFNFETESSEDDTSSDSTVRSQLQSRPQIISNHPEKQPQGLGSTYSEEKAMSTSDRPFQRLSKIALEQKAQYESLHKSHETMHEYGASWQQPEDAHSGTYAQLTHSSLTQEMYNLPSDASTKSLPLTSCDQTSPDLVSQYSSKYSPQQSCISNSSSGVSSGDTATTSSRRSRRNPIDDVLIRALAMERENNNDKQSISQEQPRVGYPVVAQQSVYVKNFTRTEMGPSGGMQKTSSRKTHELQI
ncbi:uncharacterized protein [Asterias amurensis]|uniref:uncharacterized protein isoform X1 n=1 Tax=Asterias amurensis TaxID=7602 RepID=UPI003AB33FEB